MTPRPAFNRVDILGRLRAVERGEFTSLERRLLDQPERGDRETFISALAFHALLEIRCDHEANTDTPVCNCGIAALGTHQNVGAAKEAWAAHVWEELGFDRFALDHDPSTVRWDGGRDDL